MRVAGNVYKVGRWWAVEIPLLRLHSQGRTRADALAMAVDAVRMTLDRPDLPLIIHPGKGNEWTLEAADIGPLLAFALRQQRAATGLTVREVARRLGSGSPEAYAAYERGRRVPSLDKFTALMKAIDRNLEPVLTVAG
jgi:hypothetical protein